MPTPALDPDLAAFEAALDESLEASNVWRLPRHLALTLILNRIRDLEFGGHDLTANPSRPKAAQSLIDRLPVLLPYLVQCPLDVGPIPFADADEAAPSAIEAMFGVAEVLSWLHAAELFPDLWRGWRTIAPVNNPAAWTPSKDDGEQAGAAGPSEAGSKRAAEYSIAMPSLSASQWEVRDIVLGRLTTPWGEVQPGLEADIASALDVPGIPVLAAAPLLSLRCLKAIRLSELELVDDDAMSHVVGVTNAEFDTFRDACVALGVALSSAAKHCMSEARRQVASSGQQLLADQWFNDACLWALPTLPASDVVEWLEVLTGLDVRKVNRLIGAFCEPHDATGWAGRAGEPVDGFFPPFWEFTNNDVRYLLLSPWHLQTTVMRQSLLSRYARLEPTSFHDLVSQALEPTLLRTTVPLWKRIDGVVVTTNCRWSRNGQQGEIDTLVFQRSTNTVIQVQAKASLAAISSRMVARMEDTVAKGIGQLEDVRALPSHDRDAVLTKALGVPVQDAHLVDVLMTTGGVGSAAAWSSLGQVIALNPVLLNAAIESVLADVDPALSAVAERAKGLLDVLVADAEPSWHEETVVLGLASDAGSMSVTFPALSLDQTKVSRFRRATWPEAAR